MIWLFSTERGRRFAVSVDVDVGDQLGVGDLTELPKRRVNTPVKEEESANEEKLSNAKVNEEDREKDNDADDDDSDEGDNEEPIRDDDDEEDDDDDEETESESPAAVDERCVPKIVEPSLEQESQVETESEHESDRESDRESESEMVKEVKQEQESEVESEPPTKLHVMNESSPPSDSETDVSWTRV